MGLPFLLSSSYSKTPLSFVRLGEELVWLSCRRWLCVQLVWHRPAVRTHLLYSRCCGLWVQLGRPVCLLHQEWYQPRSVWSYTHMHLHNLMTLSVVFAGTAVSDVPVSDCFILEMGLVAHLPLPSLISGWLAPVPYCGAADTRRDCGSQLWRDPVHV